MHILIVDRSGPIPAPKYGGTERVIWGLGKCLNLLGHKVTYLVPGGFKGDFAECLYLDQSKDLNIQIPNYIDVVHINYNPLQSINKPYLITMHGNPGAMDSIDKNTVFISKNQAERYNSEVYIHNGLYWEDYNTPNLNKKRDYFHFLGKASWRVKNVFGAAKIVRKANGVLKIGGGSRWCKRNFFRGFKYILDPKIQFLGMVNDEDKIKMMEKSKALVTPVLWHEPFGLAIIESLYAGCAVFGTSNGSLPELISPRVGLISNEYDTLAKALNTFEYDPQYCHEYAKRNFNAEKMTLAYLKLYEKVISGKKLHQQNPEFSKEKNKINQLT
ncbi:glycosyltransferase [Aequorivita echinoideorum]|uniref:Glycosyltransferase n=1 Tax=Aequorivita echinoideorum TaxID=1549647 RepID=A0ABS5S5K1_9FLAO|nr:glycosyltransferase [Aequorivita echinoideorum]MBT0608486.1 glycosyltransferase [Aequorivita echinoideorum]